MIASLHRLLHFLARFIAGVRQFGLRGAFRVFLWCRWQRSDRLTSVRLKAMDRDLWFRSVSDRGVLCMFYTEGYRVLDCYGTKARVIIDAGANIGDSTMRFRRFHPQARIIAIEADAENHAVLERNFADDSQVTCLHRALWSAPTTLHLQKTWSNVASRVAAEASESTTTVEACSVPSLMNELGLAEIDILKLDIEGAEAVVFQTPDTAWLGCVRCIIFECCDADDPGTTQRIFAALQSSGVSYNCHIAGENLALIRSDTPWSIGHDLWLDERGTVMPHINQAMQRAGFQRLD